MELHIQDGAHSFEDAAKRAAGVHDDEAAQANFEQDILEEVDCQFIGCSLWGGDCDNKLS